MMNPAKSIVNQYCFDVYVGSKNIAKTKNGKTATSKIIVKNKVTAIDVTDISKKTTKVRIIGDNNTVSILNKTKKNPKIIVKIDGYNNQVIIDDLNQQFTGKLYIYIWGNNSSVKIGKNFSLGLNLNINIGNSFARDSKIDNVHCKIGENCRFEDVFIQTDNSNNTISIENNSNTTLDLFFCFLSNI